MEKKPRISFPIVVEGKYDKIKIDSLFDAYVLTTGGFSIFNDAGKKALIKKLAEKTPVIFLTDSDYAGRQIRNLARDLLPKDRQIHLYIPQVAGKEKRKQTPSAEGFLGVEGSEAALLRRLLSPYAQPADSVPPDDARVFEERSGPANAPAPTGEQTAPLTKSELYERGYIGAPDSAAKRRALLEKCGLPKNLSASAMIEALNLLYSREELGRLL